MRVLIGRIVIAAGVAVGLYLAGVAGVSLRSQERILGLGQPKAFCGLYLDCHRLVTVTAVERAGTRWIVTLQYESNAVRVPQPMRGLAARVRVDDRWYERDQRAERALGSAGLPPVTLDPGETFATRVVFDLPEGAEPLLHVRDARPASRLTEFLLLGDEDSFLHRRTFFALDGDAPTATIGRLAFSLVAVETDTTAGTPWPVPADGVFYLLTVRLRGEGTFEARVVDRTGRAWQRALDMEARLGVPRVGRERWVFDVADGAEAPMLEIRPGGWLRAPLRIPLAG